ncbi:MAG: glutamate synthase subunit beta [Saprospiraceae bacterium]|nr:glutamate synthase subunit beta [Saprospiraceae bacterium]
MGKPTGFLENTRQLPAKEGVESRLKHYGEFVQQYSAADLNKQASRCMDCGIPFCHNGCPLGNIIPEFNDAVYRGQFEEAYEILASTNNFPEFTGRICPAPCESACVLGINQPPVAIEEIERHIVEIAFERGYVKARTHIHRTGKKVAVVGSGPAGLAAAAQLNSAGHLVTVFERDDAPGGLLRYGIPDFKLEKSVVDRRIRLMEEEGITFRCNAEVGKNVPVGDLLREFHAIVLAGGSTIPRDLTVPGRELDGVHFAMDFLKQQNKAVAVTRTASPCFPTSNSADTPTEKHGLADRVTAKGKHVVVIGGGDTGSDCVGTSNRQKAASVTQLELMPTPPTGRTPNMPWPTYPMVYKTTTSHEEGCERKFAILTKAFLGDENGKLRALQVVDIQWTGAKDGRPASFAEVPGSEREIPCQLALLAMGFLYPQKEGMLDQLGVETTGVGNVRASERSYQTTISKVFAAGDMRRGQSLVVWAISEGRECARKVDEYLMGSSLLETKDAAVMGFAA